MIQGKAILVIDMGNSSTKCRVKFGKQERDFELSNSFSIIEDKNFAVSSDYSDLTSTLLDVDIRVSGLELKGIVCNGEIQAREFPTRALRPTAKQKKYESRESALAIRMAFLQACREVLTINRQADFSQLDITWDVIVLLPPGDIDIGTEPMKDLVRSVNHIKATFPVVDIPILIKNVFVLPEGFCAYVGTVYDVGQTIRPSYQYLLTETVIIFDIGAGTTDCLIIRNNKPIQSSKHTVTIGGNNVFAKVRKGVQLLGYNIDDDDIRGGIITGYVKYGAKRISIVDIVNKAKREVAEEIIHDFQTYLDEVEIKTDSIGYVLACGGGAMSDSETNDIKPMSDFIVENFKIYSKGCELIPLPTHVISVANEDGGSSKKEVVISPRELNLVGASILAEKLVG